MSLQLSKSIKSVNVSGRNLNDNSKTSEAILKDIIQNDILDYATKKFKSFGNVKLIDKIKLSQLISIYNQMDVKHNTYNTHDPYMLPDGGVLILTPHNTNYQVALFVAEDKVQGTNDRLYSKGLKRQATGNAIERSAKNARAAEMMFPNNLYAYCIFANGCDFHHCETISTRLVMMNYGQLNHYIGIDVNTTPEMVISTIETTILPMINIYKDNNKCIMSVFIKAHKWDELPNGSSRWTKDELIKICTNVIDRVYIAYMHNLLLMCIFIKSSVKS